jgi:HK97 family phage portal protein
MSLIRRGVEARAGYPAYNAMVNPVNMLYGNISMWSTAGERVDEVTALGIASVLSAVTLLADSVATMPLKCYRQVPGGEREYVPVPAILQDPDPDESNTFELKHTIVSTLALHGNSYTHVERDSRGHEVGLTPLHPYQMNVLPSKDYSGRTFLHLGREIPREDLIVIRWFTPPQSLVGISPLTMQRTMFGLALAMDKYLAQWYGEGGTPSGVLETDRQLTTEAAKNLRETWESSQRKRRRPAVLSDGLKWRPVQTSAVDMEFAATRDAIIAEVARIFRIPAHLLNVKSDGQTYQNVEQASINYLTYTLAPWLTRLETAFSQFLPPDVNVEFDTSTLLRLDATTKATVDKIKIETGVRSPNEARASDGQAPYEGGDAFVKPSKAAPPPALPAIDLPVVA